MRGSWRIGSLASIGIHVHFTFLLLLGFLALSNLLAGAGLIAGLLPTLAVFGIVVLHELGHALAARHYGIGTRDITLLPIGGVARLERMPEEPKQEFVIALAGPAVNVALAGLVFLFASLTVGAGALFAELGHGGLLAHLFWTNVGLALFNLVPAFPMDGGRVLRALLATGLPYVTATRIASRVGQGVAVGFALLGLFFNPMLVLIALFVWTSARQEREMVEARHERRVVTEGWPVIEHEPRGWAGPPWVDVPRPIAVRIVRVDPPFFRRPRPGWGEDPFAP